MCLKNGIILSEYEATFNGKATVYDLLKKACDDNNIPYNAKFILQVQP
jgi:hypothetical protein